jgi:hypothetical protein
MALDVKVKIDLKKPTGRMNSNFPLILAVEGEEVTDKAYVECKTLDEVVAAGYTATTNTYKTAYLIFSQSDAPAKIAIKNCAKDDEVETLKEILLKSWRQLVVVADGTTTESSGKTNVNNTVEATKIKAIADYIETTDKLYFCSVEDVTKIATVKNATKTNDRTVVMVYKKDSSENDICPEAALVGATSGLSAGSFTYKNVILAGITPQSLTDTEIEAIHTAGGLTFVTKAGDNVTTEGRTLGGEYIDIVDSKDFVISNIAYNVQKTFNSSKKIPYDNNGIAMLETATVEVLQEAFNNGIITTNEDNTPAYTVDFALREETTENDRYARKYPYGQFSFVLAGAIHTAEIQGEMSL